MTLKLYLNIINLIINLAIKTLRFTNANKMLKILKNFNKTRYWKNETHTEYRGNIHCNSKLLDLGVKPKGRGSLRLRVVRLKSLR